MPGTIAPPEIELIIEDSRGGGGGGGRPPDGGDDGDDGDFDRQRRRQPVSSRRFSPGIAMEKMRMETIAMAIPVENRREETGCRRPCLSKSPSSPSSPPSGGLPPPPPPPRESSIMSSISGGAIVPGMTISLLRFLSLL